MYFGLAASADVASDDGSDEVMDSGSELHAGSDVDAEDLTEPDSESEAPDVNSGSHEGEWLMAAPPSNADYSSHTSSRRASTNKASVFAPAEEYIDNDRQIYRQRSRKHKFNAL